MRGRPKPLSDYVGASNVIVLRLSPLCRCDILGHFAYDAYIAKLLIIFEVAIIYVGKHIGIRPLQ